MSKTNQVDELMGLLEHPEIGKQGSIVVIPRRTAALTGIATIRASSILAACGKSSGSSSAASGGSEAVFGSHPSYKSLRP